MGIKAKHGRRKLTFTTDIYIAAVSAAHNVAAPNHWIAIVSTIVETSVPEREILPGLQLLGNVVDK
jgi:Rab GDP dissociation inhibitor